MFKRILPISVFKNVIMLFLFSLGIISLSANCLLAAPIINAVSGTISDGKSITIQGTGFGTKSPAAPLFWDNFESGNTGQLLSTSPNWDTQIECAASNNGGTPSMIFSNEKSYSGTKAAKQMLFNNLPCWSRTKAGLLGNQSKIFFSYKYWIQPGTGDHLKMGRIGGDADVHSMPTVGYTAIAPEYWYAFADKGIEHPLVYTGALTNQWVRDDSWAVLSTPNASDGAVQIWRNGVSQYSSVAVNTLNSAAQRSNYNQVFLPYYIENGTRTVYIDDVYIDKTLSRVEVCSGSTWSNRGTCEIQIPTAWSSDGTSITITINKGAFSTDSTARYLYVVDSNGLVSSGKSIIFGISTGLVPPSNLKILSK
ncbi:MAG: IPT/TIG domain-containing protein [Deltaproteobacteria bacterium]|nr:IPT/TIG domain-containing protein [Deltaproteobacteria bacterium]